MNILASSPPPPPTTHIHIHIWWSVVFSQLISGQINQRPYLQSICWEGAVGSRRHSNMLDNNRKWKRQHADVAGITLHCSLCSVNTDVRPRGFLFFWKRTQRTFWFCISQLVTNLDLLNFTLVNTLKLCTVFLRGWTTCQQFTCCSCSTYQCPKIPKLPASSRLMFHISFEWKVEIHEQ